VDHLDTMAHVAAEADPAARNTRVSALAASLGAEAGSPLGDSVGVRVTDSTGRALAGVPVTWTALNGSVRPIDPRTDSLGVARVSVAASPRVAALCTGRELVDDPATPLAPGQIRNSNGPFLAARMPHTGAELAHAETVGDDVDAFLDAVDRARAAGSHIIISTGAVSMGRYDFVPVALERLGAQVLFHKVAIRPGKPLLFARLPDGTLFFGLPGNPVAVAAGLRFFVEPALRAMLGLPAERPWQVPLAAAFAKKPRLHFYLKAQLTVDERGQLAATALRGQESYRIRPLAEANAWVHIPLEASELPAGALVDVYGLGHLESPSWSRA